MPSATRFIPQDILDEGPESAPLHPRFGRRHGRTVRVDPPSVAVLPVQCKARLPIEAISPVVDLFLDFEQMLLQLGILAPLARP